MGKSPLTAIAMVNLPLKQKTSVKAQPVSTAVFFQKGKHKIAYEAHTACDWRNFAMDVVVTPGNIHDSIAFGPLYDE